MTDAASHLLLRALADELARCGVRHACTSPGSRSTPIVLALARDGRVACSSHVDERSAGFFALGIAKATGMPAVLACTSGTAAANYAPAVIEAREARVPLLVLTADRPPELRDSGAGQTIDQLKLYGTAPKWFAEVGVDRAGPAELRWVRALACRAVWTTLEGRPGPVHLNLPLREPLVPPAELGPDGSGRPDGAPWVARPRPRASEAAEVPLPARGVVVAGREERDPAVGPAAARFAEAAGWPLLADPLSGARRGPAAIAHYDHLLRGDMPAPELVLRVGDLPTSKPLRAWLTALAEVPQVALDPDGAWQDPGSALSRSLAVDPVPALDALTARVAGPADPAWLAAWRDADARAARAIADTLAGELTEPRVAAELGARLPAEATLFVAASMPVRDAESFFPVREDPPRVLSNRGANGIDGTVSSALGVAAAGDGPAVLLIGDVALAHDIGGLLASRRLGLALTIVLLNNDGGGIFHFLPVAGERDAFEEHVATPHGLDFAHAAALYGCAHERIADLAAFRAALDRATAQRDRTTILEVRTDRAENLALHRRIAAAVSATARRG